MSLAIPFPQSITMKELDEHRAVFQIDGCYPGYGITLGNALRRVLLSSLPGTAATAVKINQVQHEFSTLPHIKEDIVQITLNLKNIHFRMHDEGPVMATLKVKGERKVTAKDLKLPSSVEITNPDSHIATITNKKGALELELTIGNGLGYVPAELKQKEKLPIGTIALDAIYTPVLHVNNRVENMRIGERTDFNRIILDITTDGSLTPAKAFEQATIILRDHFSALLEAIPKDKTAQLKKTGKTVKPKPEKKTRPAAKNLSFADIKLPARTQKLLEKQGIKTVAGLIQRKADSLIALEGLGQKSVADIEKRLKKVGLKLK